MDMDCRGLVWKRVWKSFWSEIGSGFGEPAGTPPPRIPRGTPRNSSSLFEIARTVVSLANVAIWHYSIQGRFCDENSLRNCNETLQTWLGAFYESVFLRCHNHDFFFLELIKFFDTDIVSQHEISGIVIVRIIWSMGERFCPVQVLDHTS